MTEVTPEQKAAVCLALRQHAELLLNSERVIVDLTRLRYIGTEELEGIAELLADAAFLIDGQTFKDASDVEAGK